MSTFVVWTEPYAFGQIRIRVGRVRADDLPDIVREA